MSGILALIGVDGAPVEPARLGRMTSALAFRGPDAQRVWSDGSVGLGHALLATTREATRERQPASLDGVWITADVRIDGRRDLIAALRGGGAPDLSEATDVDLLLHAYRIWGEGCVDRLLGDFAFVLWDGPRRRLFCARDPLGVKLLYHSCRGGWLVVGNTLQCVRAHPGVGDGLDPSVMASLLLWGESEDPEATVFADVRSLPGGHTLSWSPGQRVPATRRYWHPPVEGSAAPYSDDRAILERFTDLLDVAVSDRLRTDSVGIFMSGGIDSPMLAATAERHLRATGSGGLFALTEVFDRLVPDEERRYSGLVAGRLGIPIFHYPLDHLYTSWDWLLDAESPEPQSLASNGGSAPAYEEAARRGRVVLTGYDGDALLDSTLSSLWKERLRRFQLGTLCREVAWHARRGRLPRIGFRAGLRRMRYAATPGHAMDGFPTWVRADVAAGHDLEDRWREAAHASVGAETPRGRAYQAFDVRQWRGVLDPMDGGVIGLPLEHRHPLADLRLVEFALSLPTVPWCIDKELFRAALRGHLPAEVLRRPKSPLSSDPISRGMSEARAPLAHTLAPELSEYVDIGRFSAACESLRLEAAPSPALAYAAFNTFALSCWLRCPMRRVATLA